jgi:hypothetical protein
MDAISAFFLAISIAAAVWLLLAIYESIWGINLASPSCPECGSELDAITEPTSIRQLIWGGWTCRDCGCELDKWGWPISN